MSFSTYLASLRQISLSEDPDWIAQTAVSCLQDFPDRLTNLEWVRHWSVVSTRLFELCDFPAANLACRRGLARGPNPELFGLLGWIATREGELHAADGWFQLAPSRPEDQLTRDGVKRQLAEQFVGTLSRPVRFLDEPQTFSRVEVRPGADWVESDPTADFVAVYDVACEGVMEALEYVSKVYLDPDLQGLVWGSRYQFQRMHSKEIAVLPTVFADDLIAVSLRRSAFNQLLELRKSPRAAEVPSEYVVALLEGSMGFHLPSLVTHETKFVQK